MLETLVCRILGHRPTKVPRDDEGGGLAYACLRCGAEGIRPASPPARRR
ncbi:hypothetical protein Q9R32_10880 [Actinotalea sp. AC32]|nr:hypothetical protein [Actinotalea sp. AC32]